MSCSQAEKAAAVTAELKRITENVGDVTISIAAVVKAGDPYLPITNVVTLDDATPVTIEHNTGEVLLIDFWATWCPPCQKPM